MPESVHRAGVGVMLDGGRGLYHCKGDVFDPSPVPCLMEYTSSVTRQAAATVDESARFAFLATYTSRLSVHGKAQHLPLGEALREYAGAGNRERLLSLLLPVQRVAGRCEWLRQMVDSREIFHPLRWTVGEAHRFLQDVPELERAGVIVRMPSNWSAVAAGPWLAETLRRLRSPDDELACEEAVHELRGTLRTHQRAGVRWLNLLQHLVARVDLVITSYASLLRLPWLASTSWDFVILDEAQAIKNPNAKQTRAAKPSRPWRCRSCLSCGTP